MAGKIICLVILIILSISLVHCFGSNLHLTLTSEERSWISENHTVRIRVGGTPPFIISDDKIQGLAIDYIERIFNDSGIRFHYIRPSEVTWPQALQYISNHEIVDMVPTAKITQSRQEKMLEKLGYRVIIASSPVDAVKMIEESNLNDIDLLLEFRLFHLLIV